MKDTLPANIEIERFVLGSILLDDVVYPSAASALSLDDFSLEKHRRIFRRMGELAERGERVDVVTLHEELQRHNEAEACGGLSYLVSLDEGLPRVPNIDSYCGILREKADRRRAIVGLEHLKQRAAMPSEDLQDIIAAGQELFQGIGAAKQGGITSMADLPAVAAVESDVQYLIEGEIAAGSVTAYTGDSGSGKSTLVSAHGRDLIQQGVPFAVLDRENPRFVVVDRNRRIGLEDGPLYRHWGGWLPEEAPQPDAPVIMDWVRVCNPKPLIVVDSLAAFFPGDQNDASEMRAFMHRCRRLADLGAAVVVVHHDGKAETAKDYRGSSDFKAAIDAGFHVSSFGADGRLDKLMLRPFKSRFGFSGELTYSYAGGAFIRGDRHEARQTISEQLTTVLRLNPGVNGKRFEDLAAERGIPRQKARAFLGDGSISGAVRSESGGKNTRRYFLSGMEAQPDFDSDTSPF